MAEPTTVQQTVETGELVDGREPIEIDVRYAAERWRYVCPRGHIDWRPTPTGFRCLACEEFGKESTFAALIDRRAGERIPRRLVRIAPAASAAGFDPDREE